MGEALAEVVGGSGGSRISSLDGVTLGTDGSGAAGGLAAGELGGEVVGLPGVAVLAGRRVFETGA